jgi:hypothetical protein
MSIVAGQTESKILAIVHERGSMLLDELLSCLPEATWNQVFTSVDELSRRGAICLRRRGFDYELWGVFSVCNRPSRKHNRPLNGTMRPLS